MILVTVGTHSQGFDRLIKAMDQLAAEIDERVVIQRGSSTYLPQHAEHFQWTSSQQMEQLTDNARVVVAHAAAGAIILALRLGKPLVVVPRLRYYGEHFDDHQKQLAAAIASQGRAIVIYDLDSAALRLVIEMATELRVIKGTSKSLAVALRQQMNTWAD